MLPHAAIVRVRKEFCDAFSSSSRPGSKQPLKNKKQIEYQYSIKLDYKY
jgi:hypothetical protein